MNKDQETEDLKESIQRNRDKIMSLEIDLNKRSDEVSTLKKDLKAQKIMLETPNKIGSDQNNQNVNEAPSESYNEYFCGGDLNKDVKAKYLKEIESLKTENLRQTMKINSNPDSYNNAKLVSQSNAKHEDERGQRFSS